MHNHMKEKWFGRRVRAVGLERRELQLRGYQIHQGITALLAWHYRTGGDVSRYFGEWKPPDRNPKPRSSLLMLWLLHGQKLGAGVFHQHHSDFSAFFLL